MKQLSEIIAEYAKRYPSMRPQDATLLVYENEYGPGKSKEDDDVLRSRFKSMYDEVQNSVKNCKASDNTESVGNGYIRVYLSNVNPASYEALEQAYINSVRESKGGHYFLTPKLYELIDAKSQGAFEFTIQDLEEYLMEYEALDYPQPEHSDEYTMAYDAKYCVISDKYLDMIPF